MLRCDAAGGTVRACLATNRPASQHGTIAFGQLLLAGLSRTTIERTLLDIAATGRPDDLARALERAEELRLLDLRKLRRQIERSRGQRGVARLRAAVDALEPESHRTKAARDRDYDRDLGLARHGYTTHRISWDQYRHDRANVAAALEVILRPRGGPRTPARA